ncbi:hypothetical protein [Parapedobacter koreensis]|uniref:Uncharacterized protein n=1 Tax=Parapedobacter koreensis TaxID=332977 RepID=A0A1H7P5A3_9SPHI|nr:hypothetical protein [Parapedobacter koreensis]SEL30983.1 hypothetical protein SAMN05421740_104220 [Parapedobacter koreensis]
MQPNSKHIATNGTEVPGNRCSMHRQYLSIGRRRFMVAGSSPLAAIHFLSRQFKTSIIYALFGGSPKGGRSLCLLISILSTQRYRSIIKSPD